MGKIEDLGAWLKWFCSTFECSQENAQKVIDTWGWDYCMEKILVLQQYIDRHPDYEMPTDHKVNYLNRALNDDWKPSTREKKFNEDQKPRATIYQFERKAG